MALFSCSECGSQISSSASACPQCGARRPSSIRIILKWGLGLLPWIAGGFLVLLAIGYLAAVFRERGEGWQKMGRLYDLDFMFVQVDLASAKDPSVYRDAVAKLCPDHCGMIAFFLSGDPTPPDNGFRAEFFRNGGLRDYRPVAVFWGTDREFTKWDCERAGEAGAPLSALCGNLRAQYEAVVRLGTRDGLVKGCGLPAANGRSVVDGFLRDQPPERRAFFSEAYEMFLTSGEKGPDDPAKCKELRRRVESEAREARQVLRPKAAHQHR